MPFTSAIAWTFRLFMGAMFMIAGIIKMIDLQSFADSISSFQLLPPHLVNFLALGLPPCEIATGLMLITGWGLRVAGLSALCLMGVFLVAYMQAVVRGLVVNCGCFGPSHPERWKDWMSLTRDGLLFAMATWLYRHLHRPVVRTT